MEKPKNVSVVDRSAEMVKAIEALVTTRVFVGFPQSTASARPSDSSEPITNPDLAYIHQNGAPEANIPERPFLDVGVENKRDKITLHLEAAGKAAFEGDMTKMNVAFDRAGLTAVAGIQQRLKGGPFEPLKDSTLARRKRKGRTGTKPLIDSAAMLQAVRHVIQKLKKE